MDPNGSGELVARWRQGDQQAAAELFARYASRLVALARSRLSDRLARRIDPEDVVQSACRSFFGDTRAGRYDIQRGGDLWQLLVTITLHKLQHHVQYNLRGKRSVRQEQSFSSEESLVLLNPHGLAGEPSPVEAVALADEVEGIMRDLTSRDRRILELRLQGHTFDEIATLTDAGERTVRRVLERLRDRLSAANQSPGGCLP